MTSSTCITIALCTFNGADHLEEQLASFLAQTHADWELWVSDDGSTDETLAILNAFCKEHAGAHKITVVKGPGAGPAANFLSLLCHPDFPTGHPVALADQDDVWLPFKLERAYAALEAAPELALYGAQSHHTDEALNIIGRSLCPQQPPSFGNATCQNIVSGHSATLSPEALALVRRAGVPQAVPYQDWWIYLLVSAAGGTVVIDQTPVLYYRQHGENALGAHQGLRAHIKRAKQIFGRTYGRWIEANLDALWNVRNLLTPEHRAALEALRNGPKAGMRRIALMKKLGIRRQGRLGTAMLYIAAALGLS